MEHLFSAAAGYAVAQIPPYHDRAKGKASVLVLGCIDPRYSNDLAWYLTHNQKLHADYDLITMAGAELGVFHSNCWRDMYNDHINLALKLHGIEEVWVFSHMDCGMYKAFHSMPKDDDESKHIDTMNELKKMLKASHPELKFQGHIISQMGHIKIVIPSA